MVLKTKPGTGRPATRSSVARSEPFLVLSGESRLAFTSTVVFLDRPVLLTTENNGDRIVHYPCHSLPSTTRPALRRRIFLSSNGITSLMTTYKMHFCGIYSHKKAFYGATSSGLMPYGRTSCA